jgi:hypothetical protein
MAVDRTAGSAREAGRAIPKAPPPRSTVFAYLDLWSYDGALKRIHFELYVKCRAQAGREASPTAAIVGSRNACLISTGEIRTKA